ncbi:hypothetical protein CASFOL_016681 [Castilleja foliolosa]|uniref:mitogen-activated protein kinase kinase kinase n=1 Tax=Castilleja foliolosa TaxID=1961234 RepID=A0ABD3DA74_9LAMI
MHRIPRVFGHSTNRSRTGADSGATSTSTSSSPTAKPKPRLDRRNAKKDIKYDYSASASSLSSHYSSDESMRTRSLDLYDGKTSFRVEGVDGEIEIICRTLGISIDDFSINPEEYEAMKVRSISAPVAFSQSIEPSLDREMEANGVISRNCEVVSSDSASVVSSNGVRGNGIKGARPPLMSLPEIEKECSAWDMFRSFTPDCGAQSSRVEQGFCSDEDGEGLKRRSGMMRDRNCVLSASCSFTASSNDDDSSSTTTEPMNSISPNGRIKRVISEWQKGELLGRGSFGSVYEGIADDGFFFAVKEVSLLEQDDEGKQSILQLEQEIVLLSQFEHENIVQYYGTKKLDESKLYIFLELVTKGSLLSLYQKYTLRDSQVWSYTRQILHGLKYLHDRNVVHRDIKCANILVDTNGLVKLADFGLAKATKLNDVKSCKGTAFWMAPEVVRSLGYGLPADIWSLGCTVLEMLTGRFPYSNVECMAALYKIGRGERPAIPESISNDARDFILKCLQVDPSLRPTAAELLDHPFVVRPLPSSSSSGFTSPHFSSTRHQRMQANNV